MDLTTVLSAAAPPDLDLSRSLYGLGLPADPTLTSENRGIANAFRARADAHAARGEYHLAIADYGRALNTAPRNFGLERDPLAKAGRRKAIEYLALFFHCGGDPSKLPADVGEEKLAAVRATRLPAGHLVVADEGGVLAAYPLTEDGRASAVAHVEELATDPGTRSVIDNLYLAETENFDSVVYRHESGRTAEFHRAPPRSEPNDPDESAR